MPRAHRQLREPRLQRGGKMHFLVSGDLGLRAGLCSSILLASNRLDDFTCVVESYFVQFKTLWGEIWEDLREQDAESEFWEVRSSPQARP